MLESRSLAMETTMHEINAFAIVIDVDRFHGRCWNSFVLMSIYATYVDMQTNNKMHTAVGLHI